MTETNDLHRLKTLAKRYARANRIPQHQALDLIAGKLGFPNWVKLISATKNGWEIDAEKIKGVEAFSRGALPAVTFLKGDPEAMNRRFEYLEQAEHGTIGGHAYRLQEVMGDVIIAGEGWSIRVPENPSAIPVVETYTNPELNCPVLEPEFLQRALRLATDRAGLVRAEISTDWPRRSTKPDLNGVVRHPLGRGESDVWFCLHCDGKITGRQIAETLWHCPGCGASPLDIFETAFWCEDEGKSFLPVKIGTVGQDKPEVQIVDGRPKLDLDEEKITLLMRSALLDDATNVSEKLGALLAEISVDDENDVFIALEVDLWPEDKEPVQALAVSKLLGLETDFVSSWSTIPFAWPGLGEMTLSTSEYTQMMLDAYAQYGGLPDRNAKKE
ncbi:hypothetical protein NFO65_22415 [Neorhizobium galegae]|uniref:hypothetical protein n=1 Tax=Neorhizobium galegae TaxID=399 RepID=UPI0021015FD4|nr:hypothetical protein [Neorhizobium galegae]MCQ1573484.1 hypothetical protein [Neorhizobium galegae]